ncbi:uncharacterized [Tachysurus ichikawai]
MMKALVWKELSSIDSTRVGLKVKLKSTSVTPFQNVISSANYRVTEETLELVLTVAAPKPCDLHLPAIPQAWPCAHLLSKPIHMHCNAGRDFDHPLRESHPEMNNGVMNL